MIKKKVKKIDENDNKVKQLEERMASLEKEVISLKQRLTKVEQPSQSLDQEKVVHLAPVNEKKDEEWSEIKPSAKKAIDYETLIGQVWLPRIFIFVLLIGVVWGFKAASSYGILNENMKCLSGLVASGVMIWLGLKQLKNQRPILGQVLLGGAITLLMLTTFAANVLYGLIPSTTAFILNVIWVSLGIYFTTHYHSEGLGILSAIGGCLIPFLIKSTESNVYFFAAYEAIFYVSFLILSIKLVFSKLYTTAFVLLHVVLFSFLLFNVGNVTYTSFVQVVIIQHLALLVQLIRSHVFPKLQMSILVTSFLVTIVWMNIVFTRFTVMMMLLIFSALYSLIVARQWGKRVNDEKTAVYASMVSIGLMFFIFIAFDTGEGAFLLIQGTIGLYIARKLVSKLKAIVALSVYGIGLLYTLFHPIFELFSVESLMWMIMLFTFGMNIKLILEWVSFKDKNAKLFTSCMITILSILGLSFITQEINLLTNGFAENTRRLLLSFAWIVYATSFIASGMIKSWKIARSLGIGLLFLTLMKFIFYDLPNVSIAVRAILFIGLGAVGLVVSRVFYKK